MRALSPSRGRWGPWRKRAGSQRAGAGWRRRRTPLTRRATLELRVCALVTQDEGPALRRPQAGDGEQTPAPCFPCLVSGPLCLSRWLFGERGAGGADRSRLRQARRRMLHGGCCTEEGPQRTGAPRRPPREQAGPESVAHGWLAGRRFPPQAGPSACRAGGGGPGERRDGRGCGEGQEAAAILPSFPGGLPRRSVRGSRSLRINQGGCRGIGPPQSERGCGGR